MRVLIIEDEQWGAERLKEMLRECDPGIEVVDMIGTIAGAISWFQNNPAPDLLFLDIELSDGQSFEIFNVMAVNCPVIFTTSYSEFALKAFELNSIDYLLKPIRLASLQRSLDKLRQMKSAMQVAPKEIVELLTQLNSQSKVYKSRFLVRRGNKHRTISVDEIAYFYGEDKLVFIITSDREKFIVDHTLEELETLLDPSIFFRANRSFIIHIRTITAIQGESHGKLKLELSPIPAKEVIVSREKAGNFKAWLGR